MIILAYYGTGKTTFCDTFLNTIDLESPPVLKTENGIYRTDVELFCSQMFSLSFHFLRTVISQPILQVRECLSKFGIPYVVVLPKLELKDEFQSRWEKRGDVQTEIGKRLSSWNYMVGLELPNEKIIRLNKGEYIIDVWDDICEMNVEQLNNFDIMMFTKKQNKFSRVELSEEYIQNTLGKLYEKYKFDSSNSTRKKELEMVKRALQKS